MKTNKKEQAAIENYSAEDEALVLTDEELREIGKQKQEDCTVADKRKIIIDRMHDFYSYSQAKDKSLKITINQYKLINRLRKIGIYRYDVPGGGMEYVRIKDGKIHLYESEQNIIDDFEDYVRTLPDREITINSVDSNGEIFDEYYTITSQMLVEKLYNGLSTYFAASLPRLRPNFDSPVKEITIIHDTKERKYMFYNNIVLCISRFKIEFIPYSLMSSYIEQYDPDNGKYIWDTSIINRDFLQMFIDEYETKDSEGHYVDVGADNDKIYVFDRFVNDDLFRNHPFYKFIGYICGEGSELQLDSIIRRTNCILSILGYMLHDNYECNNKLALFIDAKIEDGMSSGGTGKGLIGKALSMVTNRNKSDAKYISVAGKGLDTSKDTRYSRGNLTTQIIHIEDAERNINFESLYNDVTEGAVFRKLHHDPTYHFAKMMISTNTPFNINSKSSRRRVILFELSPYFNDKRTPEDVFGGRFFEKGWSDNGLWRGFDNIMVMCVWYYMTMGLLDDGELNYEDNFLMSELSPDVYHWMQDIAFNLNKILEKRSEYKVEGLWQLFNKKYPDKYRVRHGFTKAMKLYLRTKHIPSGIIRSTEDMLVLFPEKGERLSDVIYLE